MRIPVRSTVREFFGVGCPLLPNGIGPRASYLVVPMRPRFVVLLAVAAAILAVAELVFAISPAGPVERVWAGRTVYGPAARGASLVNALVCSIGAWGLWRLKSWSRNLAMGYLAFVLVSFLLWGVQAGAEHRLAYTMGWQMFVLPFVVFCLMYLYNGEKYFE